MSRWRPILAWTWTLLVLVGTITLVALDPEPIQDVGDASFVVMATAVAALGAVIATRRPGNRIAWILLWIAGVIFEPLAEVRLADGPPDPVTILDVLASAARDSVFFIFLVIPVSLLLFLFPTGRFLTRRWSWAGWVAGVAVISLLTVVLFSIEIGIDDSVAFTVTNPLGFIDSGVADSLMFVFGVGMLTVMFGGIVAIVVRYRRSDHLVRSQIKWVALSLVLFTAVLAYRFLVDDLGGLSNFLFGIATVLIPVTITLAILRYRLYDIDRLISRTVSYVLVAGILGTVFAVGVVAVPNLVIGTGSAPPLVVAASTLVVAALFNPLRRRVVVLVDKRFNRSRYDAQHVIAEFNERLKDEIDVDQITGDAISVINATMQPSSVGVWLRN